MIQQPPRSTRTDTLFPYTTLVRSARIAAATGCKLANPGASARMERGGGLPRVGRVPYILQQALAYLKDTDEMVLVGARRPVAFFAYPGQPSLLTRSEERRVGTECVSTGRSRVSP